MIDNILTLFGIIGLFGSILFIFYKAAFKKGLDYGWSIIILIISVILLIMAAGISQ